MVASHGASVLLAAARRRAVRTLVGCADSPRRRAPVRLSAAGHVTPDTLDSAIRYEQVLRLVSDRYHPDLRVVEIGSGSGGIAESWTIA